MHFQALLAAPVPPGKNRRQLIQTLLVMNFTAILLLAACLQVSAHTEAQRITLVAKDAPLEQVLQKIRSQSGYHIVYREEWMAAARHVTINLKDASLQEALDRCFKDQPFDYSLVEKIGRAHV